MSNFFCKPNWIKIGGEQYCHSDFVLVDWQRDDLPQFAKIKDILVMVKTPVLLVERFTTLGINNHLLCHLIERTHQTFALCVSKLVDTHPFTAHTFIGDRGLYIAMRSFVVKS